MKTRILFPALLFAVLCLVHLSYAEVPQMINYQGRLTDADGSAVDTIVSMSFAIYEESEGGQPLWSETHDSVIVESGIFSVLLGVPDSVFDGTTRYLGVTVGTDYEMTPRKLVASVGYAFRSGFADMAAYAESGGPDEDWGISGDNIYREMGNVGIGTEDPSEKLEVEGNIHASGTVRSGNSITIDGINDKITATSGKIDFEDEDLVTAGNVGVGMTVPSQKLDVDGKIRVGDDTAAATPGAIRWTGANFEGYDGSLWKTLDAQSASGGGWVDDGPVVRLETGTDSVGIGTVSPGAKLDVDGYVRAHRFEDRADPTYYVDPANNPRAACFKGRVGIRGPSYWSMFNWGPDLHVNTGQDTAYVWIGGDLSANGAEIGGVYFTGSGGLGPTPYAGIKGKIIDHSTLGSGALLFCTSWNVAPGGGFGERMRIAPDGKVGIGTSSPSDLLEIAGCNERGITIRSDSGGVSPFLTIDNPDNANVSVLTARDGKAFSFEHPPWTYLVSIDTTGKVGIGTSDPDCPLHVIEPSGTGSAIKMEGTEAGVNPNISFREDDGHHANIRLNEANNNALELLTNDVTRITIAQDGKVGIGTTSPAAKLDVSGTAQMTGFKMPTGASNGYVLTSNASGVGTWQAVAGTGDITAVSAGAGLIGGGTSGAVTLDVKPGHGIRVIRDSVIVEVTDFAGAGLLQDGSRNLKVLTGDGIEVSQDQVKAVVNDFAGAGLVDDGYNNLEVNPGTGLQVSGDAVSFNTTWGDNRYVEEEEASSISSGMIQGGAVTYDKLANPLNIGANVWTWNIGQEGGILVEGTNDPSVACMTIRNYTSSGQGPTADCLFLRSVSSDAGSNTSVLTSETSRGHAATFWKTAEGDDDHEYAVEIWARTSTSEGLYVSGDITYTGSCGPAVKTSRGVEGVYNLEAPEVEMYSSGKARLVGGRANVSFDRLFAESVSSEVEVRVTVTPIGGWSALYLESTSPEGFDVRSATGDKDVEFHWMACGRRKGYETRPKITIPQSR